MKYPKSPSKPYAPYKPQPPAKQIEQNTPIGAVSFEEDSTYTLQSFEDFIKQNAPGVDPSNVKFSWEIQKEPTYYDETIISLSVNLYTSATIDNPNYDRLYAYYEEQTEKYNKEYKEYKDKLKQYKKDMTAYQEDLDAYALWHSQETIKRLTKKVAKGKKK
jgi:hypothetical protein